MVRSRVNKITFQNTKDTNTAQNGNRLRKKDGSCLDGNNTVNNPNGNGNGMRQRKQDGSRQQSKLPKKEHVKKLVL